MDGPLLAKTHSPDYARQLANTDLTPLWIAALLGAMMLFLWTGSAMAAGRVHEFLPKAQPAEFFAGADRFGPPQGDPPLVPAYQGDRLLSNDGIVGPKTWARLDPPTIKKGSSGDAVRMAQQILTDYGYDPGPVDGDFGTKTEQAVKQFQTDFGLTVDGIVGPKTWAMLGS